MAHHPRRIVEAHLASIRNNPAPDGDRITYDRHIQNVGHQYVYQVDDFLITFHLTLGTSSPDVTYGVIATGILKLT